MATQQRVARTDGNGSGLKSPLSSPGDRSSGSKSSSISGMHIAAVPGDGQTNGGGGAAEGGGCGGCTAAGTGSLLAGA